MLSALLTNLNVRLPVPMPDLSTKEKAQQYIGLDIDKMIESKKVFLETVVPVWDKEAEERHDKMDQDYNK